MSFFTYLLMGFLIVCAVSVSFSKNLLNSILIYMSFSLVMSVIWVILESPDLAITEAAVGAGITSILFFVTLKKIHAIDSRAEEKEEESTLTIHDCRQLPEPKPYRHWVTLSALLVSALFPGCGSLRHHPPVEVVDRMSHDTVYVSNWHYDSVYVYRDRSIDRSRDTVYLQESWVEQHYRLIHDTLRVCQVDTIPVVRTVEVVKPERYVPWYVMLLSWLGIIWLVLLIAKLRIHIQK